MERGEVWWAVLDELRAVVLLSRDEGDLVRAIQVVEPAVVDIDGVAIEVAVDSNAGLPTRGVVRVAVPRPGLVPCTWLVTLRPDDLIERSGRLSPQTLGDLTRALRLADME